MKYEGWYPILDFDASYGTAAFLDTLSNRFTLDESMISGGVRLPLLFNRGKYYTGVQLMAHSTWTKRSNYTSSDLKKNDNTINTMDYRFYVYHYIKQAFKDVYPKWGQVMDINYSHSPFISSGEKAIGAIEGTLYFPGVFIHNGIKLYAGYQEKQETNNPLNFVDFPRGTIAMQNDKLMSFRLNYKFPFLYPDLSLGPIFYIKRVKANLFYDRSVMWVDSNRRQFDGAGAEVTTDLHFLRFLLPLDIGIREGYRPIQKGWFTDFLFLINLNI